MMKIKKRRQMATLIVKSTEVKYEDFGKLGVLPVIEVRGFGCKKSHYVPMSENAVFRQFHEAVTVVDQRSGLEKEILVAPFLVFENKHNPEDDMTPMEVLLKGLMVYFVDDEGNRIGKPIHFSRVLRSASQYRQGKMLMTHTRIVNKVREVATYGWIKTWENKTIELKKVAKIEPYASLALTSSLPAGKGWTSIDIDDYEATVDITGALCLDENEDVVPFDAYALKQDKNAFEKDGRIYTKMELTDGQGLMSPQACSRIAYEIGQISDRQYKRVSCAFVFGMSFAEQINDEVFAPIWNKISRAVQFRFGIKKGLMVVADHGYMNDSELYDFVFPKGTIKGQVTDAGTRTEDIELAIANISATEEKMWGKLNYQFINATKLGFKELKGLADIAIRKIVKALEGPEHAMAFMGMICNDDDMYVEENDKTKVRELLASNYRAFNIKWVQDKIKKHMEKTIMDMKKGRIPVEDSRFVFIVTDPTTLYNKNGAVVTPLLGPGEYYYNGRVGKVTIFRSPLIDKSEPVVIELVSRPELDEAFGHLKNILVVNAHDDTLPRMGGADTDGDKVYLVCNQVIQDSIEKLPMIYGDTEVKADKEMPKLNWGKDGFNAIFQYDYNTLTPSRIGLVTNYCTTLVDMARDPRCTAELAEELWNLVIVGRVVQGKIIDDAKQGTQTPIPDGLKLRAERKPHWLKGIDRTRVSAWNNDPANKKRQVYHSQSPMGCLYDYISENVKQRLTEKFGELKKYNINLLNGTNYNPEAVNHILPHIAELEERYRYDMQDFMKAYPEKSEDDFKDDKGNFNEDAFDSYNEERGQKMEDLINFHVAVLQSVNANPNDIAVACLHTAEFREGRGNKAYSYPYVIATKHVSSLLKTRGNFKLVPVFNVVEDLWTTYEGAYVKVENGKLIGNDDEIMLTQEIIGNADVADDFYQTFSFNDRHYIKVSVPAEEMEVPVLKNPHLQFTIKAWKHYGVESHELLTAKLENQIIEVHTNNADNGEHTALVVDGKQVATIGKESWVTTEFLNSRRQMKVTSVQPHFNKDGKTVSAMKISAIVLNQAIADSFETVEQPTTQQATDVDSLFEQCPVDYNVI